MRTSEEENGKFKTPGDYKRSYKFKSDTSKEKKYLNISLIVSIILVIILWFLIN